MGVFLGAMDSSTSTSRRPSDPPTLFPSAAQHRLSGTRQSARPWRKPFTQSSSERLSNAHRECEQDHGGDTLAGGRYGSGSVDDSLREGVGGEGGLSTTCDFHSCSDLVGPRPHLTPTITHLDGTSACPLHTAESRSTQSRAPTISPRAPTSRFTPPVRPTWNTTMYSQPPAQKLKTPPSGWRWLLWKLFESIAPPHHPQSRRIKTAPKGTDLTSSQPAYHCRPATRHDGS